MSTNEPSIPGSRRLNKELADFKNSNLPSFKDLNVDTSNIYLWKGLICPDNPPYNQGAFKTEIVFPPEYPFKPPKVVLKTKIYHPNFDEKGQACLGILTPENWKPSTSVDQVIQAFIALINSPDPSDALRLDIANEMVSNKEQFMKNAANYTKKYSEKRP